MSYLSAEDIVAHYNLVPHPEGGFYARTFASTRILSADFLGSDFAGDRPLCTSILYLLQKGQKSCFHKIASDEIWYFHTGASLRIFEITQKGVVHETTLGADLSKGDIFQYCVKAGNYFAATPVSSGAFSFVSCMVTPGFDFAEFSMPNREELYKLFPQHKALIQEFS